MKDWSKASPFCFVLTIYRYKKILNMKFVNPTIEQKGFIPTPLATNKNVKKAGLDINNQLVSVNYRGTAAEVNQVEEKPVENEMEPSTANIIVNKLRAVGNDFKSFDPRVLRGE